MTQEYTRFTIGDFCVGGLLNIFAKKGYFGPKMTTIMEVGQYFHQLMFQIMEQYFRQTNLQKLARNARTSRNVLFCQGSGSNVTHPDQTLENMEPYPRVP